MWHSAEENFTGHIKNIHLWNALKNNKIIATMFGVIVFGTECVTSA